MSEENRSVRTFTTFQPRKIGSADVPFPADLSLMHVEADGKTYTRLAVADGMLGDGDASRRGVVLIDATRPDRLEVLSETPLDGPTLGVKAVENAEVPGLVEGPAVLAVSGGTLDFTRLNVFRVADGGLGSLEYVEHKLLSVPSSYAGGSPLPFVINQSGIPYGVTLYGTEGVYVPVIGIGVLGVSLSDIKAYPGQFLHYAPVTVEPLKNALIVGDRSRLFMLDLNLTNPGISADDAASPAVFLNVPAYDIDTAAGFPVGKNDDGSPEYADLVFAAGWDSIFYIVEAVMPAGDASANSLKTVSRIKFPSTLKSVKADAVERLAYVATTDDVYIVDINDPYAAGDAVSDSASDGRVLGKVAALPGAGAIDVSGNFAYVADPGHGQVHSVLLGCPGDRFMFIESGQYPVPPGGEVTLNTSPEMEAEWEIVKYIIDDGPGEKEADPKANGVTLSSKGVLSVKEWTPPGRVTVRVKNKEIGGCDITATVRLCDCGCLNCEGKAEFRLNSVDVRINLGAASGGHAAGELLIQSGALSDALAEPSSLEHSILGKNVKAVYDDDGVIQRIDTGKNIVAVVPGDDGYEIRFTAKGGSAPFVTWKTAATGEDGDRRFTVSEIRNGELIKSVSYAADADGNMQMFRENEAGEPLQNERIETSGTEDAPVKIRTVTEDGEVVSVTRIEYQKFQWGTAAVREITDPDGAALTVESEYYTNEDEAGYGMLKTRTRADGSSVTWVYDDDGRTVSESRYFMDAAGGQVTEYDYTPLAGDDNLDDDVRKVRTVTEKVNGIVTSKTFTVYTCSDDERTEITERAASAGAAFGDASNLRTVRIYHAYGWKFESGKLKSVTYPDGRMDTYSYEYGIYSEPADPSLPGVFTPGAGDHVRQSVVHGTAENPKGAAYKTTKDATITDDAGITLQSESYVYTGMGYERISWTVRILDEQGRPENEYRSDGTLAENIWGCCNIEQKTDARGLTSTYNYDDLDRIESETRESLKGEITTSYTYEVNSEGRRHTRTVSAGGLNLSTSTQYDRAGRTKFSIDAAGLTTSYSYANGGRTTTVLRPGGAEEITERYLDGRTRSISGSGVIPRFYEYGVESGGTQWTKVYTGSTDASSPLWEKTVTDMLGRTVRTEKPGADGIETAESYYDGKGRLIKSEAPGQAAMLYEYDELGNQVRSGLDVDGNGILEAASADRITESESKFVQIGTEWWQQGGQNVYAEKDSAAPTAAGTRRTRVTGLGASGEYGILTGESVSVDIHGNETVQKSYLDRSAQTETRVVNAPDSDINAVSISEMGLLTSSKSRTGITVTYDYDALGRRTKVTDPRIGEPTVTAYNAKGQAESVTDAAGNAVTYIYDALTGRKSAEKNALDKYTRYAYNGRGQVTNTWGDAVYPVKYVYDDYGRLAEMHTYRSGDAWNSDVWPGGVSADVTKWIYDEATGLLTAKEYADGKQTVYDYAEAGKLEKRTWARLNAGQPLTTSYSYDPATGELVLIDYSDETPDISFGYDRLGRQKTVTDAVGNWNFAYNDALQLQSETLTGTENGAGDFVLTRNYENETGVKGRANGFRLGDPASPEYAVTYGYDGGTGRFASVAWSAGAENGVVNYSYVPKSDLLAGYTSGSGIGVLYTYESRRNLKTAVENTYDTLIISRYAYRYDELGRRTDVVNTGTAFTNDAFSRYGYNNRSEVTSSERFLGSNPEVPGTEITDEKRTYAYDPIGNRKESVAGTQQAVIYETNVLNQYESLKNADETPVASPAYDDDGNMTAYKDNTCTWNAENRLVSVETADKKVDFLYDYMGRRVRKQIYAGSPGSWSLESEKQFVYNGWNLVQEIAVSGGGSGKYFVWGPDLSVSLQGAGGIGGLICGVDNGKSYYYFFDGNGNVGQVVDEAGGIVARYEYDAFGKIVAQSGAYAEGNAFRFSTKYFDVETGFYYYGFRYYVVELGRWMNIDPLNEDGGINLFSFIENSPINDIDTHGLAPLWWERGGRFNPVIERFTKSPGHDGKSHAYMEKYWGPKYPNCPQLRHDEFFYMWYQNGGDNDYCGIYSTAIDVMLTEASIISAATGAGWPVGVFLTSVSVFKCRVDAKICNNQDAADLPAAIFGAAPGWWGAAVTTMDFVVDMAQSM